MTTVIGIIIGIVAVVYAINDVSHQDVSSIKSVTGIYISLPSFLIVFGGTLASTLIGHPFSHLIHGFMGFFRVFFRKAFNFGAKINQICDFGDSYNKRGLAGLEEKLASNKDESLFIDGIKMTVNGYKPEEISDALDISINRRYDREMIDYYVFKTMAKSAPAFGMVGTLVGLIFMLNVMGKDPSKIGPFLAVALITTFYGLILAHLLFNPMGNKMLHQAEFNIRIRKMEKEGVMYILQKQHPVFIRDQLSSYALGPQPKEKQGKKDNGK